MPALLLELTEEETLVVVVVVVPTVSTDELPPLPPAPPSAVVDGVVGSAEPQAHKAAPMARLKARTKVFERLVANIRGVGDFVGILLLSKRR